MRRTVTGALGAVVLTVAMLPGSATADSTPDPTSAPTTGQRREADRLAGLATAQRRQLAAATAEVNRLAGVVAAAQAAQTRARGTETKALAAAAEQNAVLDDADAAVKRQHRDLGAWAATAYSTGLDDPHVRTLQTVLEAGNPDEALNRMSMLDAVGRVQDRAVTGARQDAAALTHVTALAERYRATAVAAAKEADRQQEIATKALAAQQTKVATIASLWRTAQNRASAADRAAWAAEDTARAVTARTYAAADKDSTGATVPGGSNATNGPTGECTGQDISGYGNGRIPLSALCPLFAAPGQYLRADAAYQFGLMSQAFAAQFGTPICVKEGYRTYAEQVELKRTKPGLSATPGYSNHGWAVAADLCGGINRFNTPQHEWMLAHAATYGWYHPSWAEPNGRLPEAWHWQFRWTAG